MSRCERTWHFAADAVQQLCDASGALSSIHQSGEAGSERTAIVPGMLTFLMIEDLARGLCNPPLHLDVSFRRPIPVGVAATVRTSDESTQGAQTWRVEVLIDADIAVIGKITSDGAA